MKDTPLTKNGILAWHWVADTRKLRGGKALVDGKTYAHNGNLHICESGLHASIKIRDALIYAPGPIVCRVECSGRLEEGGDKLVCSRRKVLWSLDATTALRVYARWCASQVLHLWNAPDVVKQYLSTGDESISAAAGAAAWDAKAAARAAAWDAAEAAARASARTAAWAAAEAAARASAGAVAWDARAAAWDAAGAAARATAWDAADAAAWDAWDAAWAAVEAAARDAQNAKLEELIMADREKEEDH